MALHGCCRSWWAWSSRADSHDRAALRSLEERLSIEEVAHFRAFVAARSSTLLAASEVHMRHAVDAVDAVVANLGKTIRVTMLLLSGPNILPDSEHFGYM